MRADFNVRQVTKLDRLNERTVWIELDQALSAQPGQFVMVWLPGVGERPFSIAGMDLFSLLVVDVGPVSHALHQLHLGDPLWVKGPLGHGFSLTGESLVLVGGGYGAAPLWPLAQLARSQGKAVTVCLGARNQNGLLLAERFAQIGCKVLLATDDGSAGIQGLVTRVVKPLLAAAAVDELYACGPTGMLSALAAMAKSYAVSYQLSWEAHMRCGMGLCGSCEVSQASDPALPLGWLACFDGPVFKYP